MDEQREPDEGTAVPPEPSTEAAETASVDIQVEPAAPKPLSPEEKRRYWEEIRSTPEYGGQIGRDAQKLVADAEARGEARARVLLEAEKAAADRKAYLASLDKGEYGELRQQEDQQLEYQAWLAGQQRLWQDNGQETAYRRMVGIALEGLPESEQQQILGKAWQNEEDFSRAVFKARARHEADVETLERMTKLEQESEKRLKRLEEAFAADEQLNGPRVDLSRGSPAGAASVGRNFKYADEAERAFNDGEISAADLRRARANLSYSYERTG